MPLANEAPAKALVAQSQALRAELQTCDVGMVLHDSTQKVLHGHVANSSRQFKRAVGRFGFALNLFSRQSHILCIHMICYFQLACACGNCEIFSLEN